MNKTEILNVGKEILTLIKSKNISPLEITWLFKNLAEDSNTALENANW